MVTNGAGDHPPRRKALNLGLGPVFGLWLESPYPGALLRRLGQCSRFGSVRALKMANESTQYVRKKGGFSYAVVRKKGVQEAPWLRG